jgi:hypothetical protein
MGGAGTGIPVSLGGPPAPPDGANTVKTNLLQAIEARLNLIPQLADVKRWEDIPTDLSLLTLPAAFFWEEERQEAYNRLTLGTLNFWVEVFFSLDPDNPASFTTFSETAEAVAGRIAGMFAAPGELRAFGLLQAQPADKVVKARYNSDYGVLFMSYELTYVHAAGNAFSVTG